MSTPGSRASPERGTGGSAPGGEAGRKDLGGCAQGWALGDAAGDWRWEAMAALGEKGCGRPCSTFPPQRAWGVECGSLGSDAEGGSGALTWLGDGKKAARRPFPPPPSGLQRADCWRQADSDRALPIGCVR